jgi:hypothetical protein
MSFKPTASASFDMLTIPLIALDDHAPNRALLKAAVPAFRSRTRFMLFGCGGSRKAPDKKRVRTPFGTHQEGTAH